MKDAECQRWIFGVGEGCCGYVDAWSAKVTNEEVCSRIGLHMSLDAKILKQKLTNFGHVMKSNGLEKSIMLGMDGDARGRGRPRKRWLDEVLGTHRFEDTGGTRSHSRSLWMEKICHGSR